MVELMQPITATVNDFRRLSGLGRDKIYELIGTGDLQSVLIGGRRFIVIASYLALIERMGTDVGPRGFAYGSL